MSSFVSSRAVPLEASAFPIRHIDYVGGFLLQAGRPLNNEGAAVATALELWLAIAWS